MKLVSVRTADGPRQGVLDEYSKVVLLENVAGGELETLLRTASAALDGAGQRLPVEEVELGAPIDPGKIVCVGANYAEHVRESNAPMPKEPILFLKNPDTVVGPKDAILVPRGSASTDWEVELGVVIGREAAYLEDRAPVSDYISGYVLADDISERDFQLERGGTWDKGKNCRTFCPLGPYLVTADEIPDPQKLRLGLDVSGVPFQDASTSDMIFPVSHLITYISQYMTLYPGDLVITGTPVGVGMGQSPPRYLAPGDSVRAWAEGLGEQRNPVEAG